MNILKKAHCGKISTPEKEWVSLNGITEYLPNEGNFNASALTPLFKSKSTNNAGFLATALKAESLLLPINETKRLHSLGNITTFNKAMLKLVKNKITSTTAVGNIPL